MVQGGLSRPRLRPRKAVRLTPDLCEADASPSDGRTLARLRLAIRGGVRLRSPMPTLVVYSTKMVDYSTKMVDYSTITRGAEGRRKPPMMDHAPRARRQPRVTDLRPAYIRRELNFIYIERDIVCGFKCGCGTLHARFGGSRQGRYRTKPSHPASPRWAE